MNEKEFLESVLKNYYKWASEATVPTENDISTFSNILVYNVKKAQKEGECVAEIIGKTSKRKENITFKSKEKTCLVSAFGMGYTVSFKDFEKIKGVKVLYNSKRREGPCWAYCYVVEPEGQKLADEILKYIELG